MIQKLFIQNYAIIERLEIDFSDKLNVITGETGAGKSIIVGALALILGERADTSMLVDKEKKCFVEGVFDLGNKIEIENFFLQNELEITDEIIIRREIGINGKSRAFVNDTPVTLSQLTELSSSLVDLHQQFDILQLSQSNFQREVLDALATNAELLAQYQQIFRDWQSSKKECDELREQKQQFEKETDYNQFQFGELKEADFRENEIEELDAELKLLSNSEGIKAALSKVYYELKESESALADELRILYNQLQNYSSYHPGLPDLLQRLQSSHIELQDIADESDRINDHIHHDARRIEQISERLFTAYRLLKKHGVRTTAELLQIQQKLADRLKAVLNIDEELKLKERQTENLFIAAKRQASMISERRQGQIKPLEDKVNHLLERVGMPNAKLKVDRRSKNESLDPYGADAIDFLFDANRSGQFQPIRKVASGGELSRLMLCIKSLVGQSVDLSTMVFDEIDSGISGEAARQVGIIMKELAEKRQLICITHQPQIASKADAHYFVYKEIIRGGLKTNIRLLTTEERIATIARMLGGEKPTQAAMENAREMVMN